MLNNVIAFTKDNWKTVSLAICQMVVAENLFGKVVASNKLMITNINDAGESTFLVDKIICQSKYGFIIRKFTKTLNLYSRSWDFD